MPTKPATWGPSQTEEEANTWLGSANETPGAEMISDAQRIEALRLFYDEGMTLGEVADRLNLPRGVYDLSPWITSGFVREQMRKEGRWKPVPRDLAWHLKVTAADL